MRINNNLIADQVLQNLQSSMNRLASLQSQLSSGKKFEKPSDNPVEISRVMRLNGQMNKDDQYMRNLDNALPILQATASSLSSIATSMNSADTLIKQYMNFATNEGNKDLLASNLTGIISAIIDTANSNYNGKYVFGGQNSTQKTFELVGNKVRYNGTDDTVNASISESEIMALSIPGNDVFVTHSIISNSYYPAKDTTVNDLTTNQFSITVGDASPISITVGADASDVTLEKVADAINHSGADVKAYIKETASGYKLKIVSSYVGQDGEIVLSDAMSGGILEKMGIIDNTNAIVGQQSDFNKGVLDAMIRIRNKMSDGTSDISEDAQMLKDGYQNVVMNEGKAGIMTQAAEARKSLMEDMKIKKQELLSNIQDIDYAEVMMELNKEMTAYQSAVQSGSKIMMPTLLDYLK